MGVGCMSRLLRIERRLLPTEYKVAWRKLKQANKKWEKTRKEGSSKHAERARKEYHLCQTNLLMCCRTELQKMETTACEHEHPLQRRARLALGELIETLRHDVMSYLRDPLPVGIKTRAPDFDSILPFAKKGPRPNVPTEKCKHVTGPFVVPLEFGSADRDCKDAIEQVIVARRGGSSENIALAQNWKNMCALHAIIIFCIALHADWMRPRPPCLSRGSGTTQKVVQRRQTVSTKQADETSTSTVASE